MQERSTLIAYQSFSFAPSDARTDRDAMKSPKNPVCPFLGCLGVGLLQSRAKGTNALRHDVHRCISLPAIKEFEDVWVSYCSQLSKGIARKGEARLVGGYVEGENAAF